MAHHTVKKGYAALTERLNRFPQGAPPSDLLRRILSILFTEREARMVSLLPIKPFTARKAADIWKIPLSEAQKTLDALAERCAAIVLEEFNVQRLRLKLSKPGAVRGARAVGVTIERSRPA